MELLDFKVSDAIKKTVEDLSRQKNMKMSEVIRHLARIGMELEKKGGIRITGPLGLDRPFAIISHEEERNRISILLDQEIIKELKECFKTEDFRDALRQALRLGFVYLYPESVSITGPLGRVARPFAKKNLPKLKDEKARESFDLFVGK